MTMKKVDFMLTAFRDGFQSVYGCRVLAADFMPAVQAAKEAGVTHFEAGGGAMFQSAFFYANENAFDNMDLFRKTAGPDANLQTLARGVNVVGLESQSSDIIKLHAELFKKHGMTTIRNFDALNDVNNLIYSGGCIKAAGLKHEVVVTLMGMAPGWPNPDQVHTPEFYVQTLKKILDAGIEFDSICFKDASGTTPPETVGNTIALARKLVGDDVRIAFHTHETAGASIACYLAAIRAGANQVDLSFSPVSGGTCQPDVATMWHALRGTEYTLDIDIAKIMQAEKVFKECMKEYFLPPEALSVDPRIPFAPMPGGALTANTQMMRDAGILDKYEEVFSNMGECVQKGGYGTSVTPVSQFYFQQAFNNTMFGPWEKFADGYGKMVLGYFGKTPVAPDPEIVKLASEKMGLPPTTQKVREINDADPKKGRKPAEEKLRAVGLPATDENVFIAAACGDKGIQFLEGKAKKNIRKDAGAKAAPASPTDGPCEITIDGHTYTVVLEDHKVMVNGHAYDFDLAASGDKTGEKLKDTAPKKAAPVPAPLPGLVLRLSVNEGARVAANQTILVLESMKMETEIKAPSAGTVTYKAKQGDQVQTGDILAEVK